MGKGVLKIKLKKKKQKPPCFYDASLSGALDSMKLQSIIVRKSSWQQNSEFCLYVGLLEAAQLWTMCSCNAVFHSAAQSLFV